MEPCGVAVGGWCGYYARCAGSGGRSPEETACSCRRRAEGSDRAARRPITATAVQTQKSVVNAWSVLRAVGAPEPLMSATETELAIPVHDLVTALLAPRADR
jgi:hypothetical protein